MKVRPLRCALFHVDVSPPIGHALCGGLVPRATGLRDPLYARGIILDDGRTRVVLCAVDYCAITDTAHRQATLALAKGAKVPPSNVALHTVHQHDAPYIQLDAEPLLRKHGIGQLDTKWWAGIVQKLGEAAAKAAKRLQPITSIGVGEARVSGCASNRRLVGPNGKIHAMRLSMETDPKLQAWPVGLIDPLLRTITLWRGSRLVATLNYYANHPQSAYTRGLISADTIGEALRRTHEKFPSAFHMYFNGCGGNLTYGKYATKDLEGNIRTFGARIADGIARAIQNSESKRAAPGDLRWRNRSVTLPFRVQLSATEAKRRLASSKEKLPLRVLAAWSLTTRRRSRRVPRITVQSLQLGPARVIHLPSEVFVEYQLYAQSMRPEEFVAIAAYGDGKMFYLPTAKAFAEGGYEVCERVCYTTPGVEPILKRVIRDALGIVSRH